MTDGKNTAKTPKVIRYHEEMITMMSTTFDQVRLQPGFTFLRTRPGICAILADFGAFLLSLTNLRPAWLNHCYGLSQNENI